MNNFQLETLKYEADSEVIAVFDLLTLADYWECVVYGIWASRWYINRDGGLDNPALNVRRARKLMARARWALQGSAVFQRQLLWYLDCAKANRAEQDRLAGRVTFLMSDIEGVTYEAVL